MAVEVQKKPNVEAKSHAYLEERKKVLDRRLRKWANWWVGSGVTYLAGWGITFLGGPVAWMGLGVVVGAAIVNTVATIGLAGNVIRSLRK